MMKKIKITEDDEIFFRDGSKSGIGCGSVNDDGLLYFIDTNKGEAYCLPPKYKDTPIVLWHPCGGYNEGLIMVSLLGKIDLQYYHTFSDTAGMWGWIDLEGNEVIPPQFVYAMSFFDGKAVVCRGTWDIDERGRYWCDDERWGMIDKSGKEIVPCMFDEIFEINGTERFILCHKGGWKGGKYCVYDIEAHDIAFDMDFEFDNGYMFNECFYKDGRIYFDKHEVGKKKDYIYIYDIGSQKWIAHNKKYTKRKFKGKRKVAVKMGNDHEIIVF